MSEYDEVVAGWEEEARKKKLPDEFIERLAESDSVTEEEKAKIVRSVKKASDVKVPGTLKNSIDGLAKLGTDEIPIPGVHYVVWGSHHLSDIKARPVKRTAPVSEDVHASREVEHTKVLLAHGLKDAKVPTNPETGAPGVEGGVDANRVDRTDRYARWRYKGYISGEVTSL